MMKHQKNFLLIGLLIFQNWLYAQPTAKPSAILILGSDHLENVFKEDKPNTDVLLPRNQQSIARFISFADKYKPDQIMIEMLPEKQPEIDSLFTLYLQNKLKLEELPDGRSEVYQIAFRIAKKHRLQKIVCVNAPGGTSQSILDSGDNINLYRDETIALRKVVSKIYADLAEGKISFTQFLQFLNKPETYKLIYHLRYITPARVRNGHFKNPDAMIDTAFIDPRYIGAELSSVFKNRDYKIYSNIVNAQMKSQSARILLIIGVAHIGSLRSLFRDDDAFELVDIHNLIK